MKSLIHNSGLGLRMGVLTSEHPKCMTWISSNETILSRQLRQLADAGIEAENALNELNGAANITALDIGNLLCAEIDDPEDFAVVSAKL